MWMETGFQDELAVACIYSLSPERVKKHGRRASSPTSGSRFGRREREYSGATRPSAARPAPGALCIIAESPSAGHSQDTSDY